MEEKQLFGTCALCWQHLKRAMDSLLMVFVVALAIAFCHGDSGSAFSAQIAAKHEHILLAFQILFDDGRIPRIQYPQDWTSFD